MGDDIKEWFKEWGPMLLLCLTPAVVIVAPLLSIMFVTWMVESTWAWVQTLREEMTNGRS